ncbi:hypothetical protein FRC09_010960, partial [Ceratobasidium sp. 395]
MSPPSVWIRCGYCRNTYKTEPSLNRHLSQKARCRIWNENRLRRLEEETHRRINLPTAEPQTGLPVNPTPSTNAPLWVEDTLLNDAVNEELAESAVQNDDAAAEESENDAPPESVPVEQPAPRKKHGYATIETHADAGRVLRWERARQFTIFDNPLEEPSSFETGEWLCQLPISNADRDRYFLIERHKKGLLWENSTQLYRSVDALPHGPDWSHKNIKVSTREGSEILDIWKRSSLEAVQALIGDVRFNGRIRYAPERHFRTTPDGRRVRVRSEQDALGGDATIVPIFLATDETHLSLFSGNRKAWPVYLTIGNIDKDIRKSTSEHAMLLIGYIPAPDLAFISNPEERRQKKWDVYHAALAEILAPIRRAASVGVEVVCADGGVRRIHPIVAGHMADFKEQCLASCTRESRCPICDVPAETRGDGQGEAKIRTRLQTLQALNHARRGYTMTQHNLGLRPNRPYWANLP